MSVHLEHYDGVPWCQWWDEVPNPHSKPGDKVLPYCSMSGAPKDAEAAAVVAKVDCKWCLSRLRQLGELAANRMRSLRPNRHLCPYESHAGDCDCGGSGGDR